MNSTISVQLPSHLADWLSNISKSTGLSPDDVIRNVLTAARQNEGRQPYMEFSGCIDDLPPDLSSRKGFGGK